MKKKKKLAVSSQVNATSDFEFNSSSYQSTINVHQLSHGVQEWSTFVKVVVAHVDPVLASMLYVTEFLSFDEKQKVVRVATLKKFSLFQDLFIEQKKIYQEYLDRIFGFNAMLVVEFINVTEPKAISSQSVISKSREQVSSEIFIKNTDTVYKVHPKNMRVENEHFADVSDSKRWKVTHALLEHFGGTVREVIKDTTHEFDA